MVRGTEQSMGWNLSGLEVMQKCEKGWLLPACEQHLSDDSGVRRAWLALCHFIFLSWKSQTAHNGCHSQEDGLRESAIFALPLLASVHTSRVAFCPCGAFLADRPSLSCRGLEAEVLHPLLTVILAQRNLKQ